MRKNILIKLARLAEYRPGAMLVAALIVSIIAAAFASKLQLSMHFKNLMPQDHPMVQEYNRIVDDYSTASMIIIAARGKEQNLKAFADELAPQIEALPDFVQRVDYKLERDFYLNHGFMLQKEKDLKNSRDLFEDLGLLPLLTHLNDNFEKTYVYDEESLSNKEKENNAVRFLDSIQYWLETMGQYVEHSDTAAPTSAKKAVDRFLIGDEYFISQDKDMLLLFAQPTFTINDVDKVIAAENTIDAIITKTANKFPSVFAGTTGTIALTRDETTAASEDMYITSIIAFLLIIALFVVSFRMWVAPLLAGISLLMGIIWTAGFASITVGSLNIFTSMFSVILIGLGVDFSIHIISVYTENRASAQSIGESLKNALLKSGNGVIIGALTTSLAFFTLTVSHTAGMSEFGIVAGSGVLFCMIATLWALPAMLSFRDRILIRYRREKYTAKSMEFKFLGKMGTRIAKKPLLTLGLGIALTIVLLFFALNITFDYNYLNMEPKGLTSIKLQDQMIDEFDITPDFSLITTSSVEESRKIAKAAKDLKMVGMVTSISDYVPSPGEQEKRSLYIQKIKNDLKNNTHSTKLNRKRFQPFIKELQRLEDNVIELAQLAFLGGQDKVDRKCKKLIGDLNDPKSKGIISFWIDKFNTNESKTIQNMNQFQNQYESYMRKTALGMTSLQPIKVENLPQNILDQFENKDGTKYLVSIYPKQQVWDLAFLARFTSQMQQLDSRVTGMPNVFYVLIHIIGRDGKIAATLTLIVIFLLLFLDFRRLSFVLMAMIPLIIGAVWMIGIMNLLGLQLTLVNVMGLPLILGIGIDDGVHILHRYRVEGKGNIRTVFTSTGKAILLTSLTTMLAFGSLVFATYRGLGSLGIALFIGVGTCFLASVLIIPALLGWSEKVSKKSESKTNVHSSVSHLTK